MNSLLTRGLRSRSRRSLTALTAASTAALVFGLTAPPAAADPEDGNGATGQYNGNFESGQSVSMNGAEVGTRLFELDLDSGDSLSTYCIDFLTAIQETSYVEDDWANYPGRGDFDAQSGKVHWILQNSYPSVGVDALAEASGVEGLTQEEALTGTQAAIWHFSNGVELDEGSGSGNTRALYDYLLVEAEDQPQNDEPAPVLTFDPESAEGQAGEIVGEFTVATSADEVPLELEAADGVSIVDMDGNPIESVGDGDTFGVMVPEDAETGEATVSATVESTVQVGRMFVGAVEGEETQTLITAESGSTSVDAAAMVSWTEADDTPPDDETTPPADDETTPPADDETTPPEDDDDDDDNLPVTGPALAALVAAAVAAIGGGGAALYLARKRRGSVPTAEG